MKKYMSIALAMLATSAFSQTSSVTIYGVVDLGVRRATGFNANNAPADGSSIGVASGVDSTSRLGLRGVEDLGGGMRAIFNLESGFSADTGQLINAAKYFDRASWVGLAGDWGRVTAGRQTTLLAETVVATDPLGLRFASLNPNVATTALSAHGLGIEYGPAGSAAGSYRLDNSLKYAGTVGNLTGSLMAGFGETANGNAAQSSKGAGLQYVADALTLSAAYQTFRANDARELNGVALGAAYRFENIRIAATYGQNRADTTLTAQTRQRVSSLGFTWAASPAVDVIAMYSKLSRSRTGARGDGYDRIIAFTEYKLSKRSKLFLEADATLWRNGYQGVGIRSRSSGLTLGISHNF